MVTEVSGPDNKASHKSEEVYNINGLSTYIIDSESTSFVYTTSIQARLNKFYARMTRTAWRWKALELQLLIALIAAEKHLQRACCAGRPWLRSEFVICERPRFFCELCTSEFIPNSKRRNSIGFYLESGNRSSLHFTSLFVQQWSTT